MDAYLNTIFESEKKKDKIISEYWEAFKRQADELIRLRRELQKLDNSLDFYKDSLNQERNKSVSIKLELDKACKQIKALNAKYKAVIRENKELERKLGATQQIERQRQQTRSMMWVLRSIANSPPLID